ncbi:MULTISPECIES: hypothetical protein [unclassified Campylobacter]|uniref:hypothetical protein n=2 Tax=unclassified Campylobacter TaxID=2593542 RepID=UPI0022E9E768|nr:MULTISPECIES: hypothetical protein [unclassified Campylobacter]MDA3043591.1 hypothetical protein [Campylobacter sp. JMF_09 ED2]
MKNILLFLLFLVACIFLIKGINLPMSLKGTTLHQGKFVNYYQPQQSSKSSNRGIICEITLDNETIYASNCPISPELFKSYGKTMKIYTHKDFFKDRERIYKISILENNKEHTIGEFPKIFIVFETIIIFMLFAIFFKIIFKHYKFTFSNFTKY